MSAETITSLRLLADDLTGALDTAAEFVPLCGSVAVLWEDASRDVTPSALPAHLALAIDAGTREKPLTSALSTMRRLASAMALDETALSFFKVDSLLRGHAGAELAACLSVTRFEHVIYAPAFPYQNRRTVHGRQQALINGSWTEVGEDVATTLEKSGFSVARRKAGDAIPSGISVWDCSTDLEIEAVVREGLEASGPVLWVGCGGLANGLTRVISASGSGVGSVSSLVPHLQKPLLGLFGTKHCVTVEQISCVGNVAMSLPDGGAQSASSLKSKLSEGAVIASFDLPEMSYEEAAIAIKARLQELLPQLVAPGLLVCGGGETFRAVCEILGVEALEVVGRVMPGVPVSRIVGGSWSGVSVVSKSGAFGAPDFLLQLLSMTHSGEAEMPLAEEVERVS